MENIKNFGFRVDRVKGGFLIREIHSKNRDKRKLIVMSDLESREIIMKTLEDFIDYIKQRFEKANGK